MAFDVDRLMREPTGPTYTATEHIHIRDDGAVCAETDPDVAFLLVAKGDTIPIDVARAHGLIKPRTPAFVDDLSDMTVAELRDVAATTGISLHNARSRSAMIEAIRATHVTPPAVAPTTGTVTGDGSGDALREFDPDNPAQTSPAALDVLDALSHKELDAVGEAEGVAFEAKMNRDAKAEAIRAARNAPEDKQRTAPENKGGDPAGE